MVTSNKYYFCLIALCLLGFGSLHAQTKSTAPAKPKAAVAKPVDMNDPIAVADMKFNAKNYEDALVDYLKLLEKDDKNAFFNFRLGACYVETNVDKLKALTFLEFAAAEPKVDKLFNFYMGKAQAYALNFDKAIEYFKKFAEATEVESFKKETLHEIEMCQNAKELIKYPVAVTFENLGASINSPFADYSPFISQDETFLMYNSQRPENAIKKANGKYTSNVYISTVKDGKWMQGEDIGESVNTKDGDEEIVGVCADGNTLIFSFDNADGKGDVFVGPKMDNQILKPFKVNPNINSSKFEESSASIAPDGKTLYFASNRPGGLGGFDIYRTRILPNGEWGEAYNLGPDVNTSYDDDFPNISLDGYTLYFSSKGHNSMGGYDVFKSDILEDTLNFGPAKNVGYPVNTPFDDKNLCMSGKGRYGYMAALRKEGMGDLDIYRLIFKNVDAELTVVKGTVKNNTLDKIPTNCMIEVFESKSNNTFGQYKVNSTTGKYVMILPPGSYYMEVRAAGFKAHSEDVKILDKGSYVPSIEKNMTLLPE